MEFALLLPLFLTIVVGIIEWGWVFFVDLTLTNAVREGARVGVTKTEEEQPEVVAVQIVKDYVDGANVGVNWADVVNDVTAQLVEDDDGNRTGELEVDATIKFEPLIGFLPKYLVLPETLKAKATMRWELADVPTS